MAKLESVLDQVLKHLRVQSRDYTTINTTTHHTQLPAGQSLGGAGPGVGVPAVSVFRGTRQSVTTRQMAAGTHCIELTLKWGNHID